MAASRRAAAAQFLALVYLEIIEWVPLPPWNDLTHGNGQEALDIALGISLALVAFGTAAGKRIAMLLALVAHGAWFVLQAYSWWVPYLFDGSTGWRRTYAYWFSRTVKFLPPIGDHPVPDASHTVLQLLLAVALVLTLLALLRGGVRSHELQ